MRPRPSHGRSGGGHLALVSPPAARRKPYTRRAAPVTEVVTPALRGEEAGVAAIMTAPRVEPAVRATADVVSGMLRRSDALRRDSARAEGGRARAELSRQAATLMSNAMELMFAVAAAEGGGPGGGVGGGEPAAVAGVKRRRGDGGDDDAPVGPLDAFVSAGATSSKRRRLEALKGAVSDMVGSAPVAAGGGSRGCLQADGELEAPCAACGVGRVYAEGRTGSETCVSCGAAQVGHSLAAEWREGVRYSKSCQYNPVKYFQRWLTQLQGADEEVPPDVLAAVGAELRARRYLRPVEGGGSGGGSGGEVLEAIPELQPAVVKAVLKSLRLSRYYSSQWQIAAYFNPAARLLRLSANQEVAMVMLFQGFLRVYGRREADGRINNPHYPFIIAKFLVIIGEDAQVDRVPGLSSTHNRDEYEAMWRRVHRDLPVSHVEDVLSGRMSAAEAHARFVST